MSRVIPIIPPITTEVRGFSVVFAITRSYGSEKCTRADRTKAMEVCECLQVETGMTTLFCHELSWNHILWVIDHEFVLV